MNLIPRSLLHFVILLALLSPAFGQSRLQLLDAATDEPVAGATVRFRALEGTKAGTALARRSDGRGMVTNPFASRAVFTVTHVGYEGAQDTLEAVGERSLKLRPRAVNGGMVVVTGQAEPTAPYKTLAAVRVIDRAQIQARSATTLRDLLVNEIGVGISNDLVLGSSLSLQGLSGQNVKVLVDGVPVVGRVGGSVDLSQLPLGNAEQVEIVEGPMSVLYGTDALGGVVNIITSKRTRGSLSGSAHMFYESVGQYTADARAGAFIGDTRFWVSGGRTLFTGYADPDTTRAKRWKPREMTTFDADITHFLGTHTISLSANLVDDYILNRGLPRPPYRETAFDDTYRTRRTTARLLSQGSFGDESYELSASYSGYARRKNTFLKNLITLETMPSEVVSDNDTSTVNTWNLRGRMNGQFGFAPLTWEAGTEAVLENLGGRRIDGGEKHQEDYALFGRLEYTPFQRLTLQPAIRLTHNTRYAAPVVPSFHVRFSPDSAFVIRGSYGRGFRAPSLRDLYFTFVDINHNIQGNKDLRAETSHNFNAGVSWTNRTQSSLLELGLNGYFNDVHDLITLVADTGDLYTYRNIGDVRTIGGRLSSTLRWEQGSARLGMGLTGTSGALTGRDGVPAYIVTPEIGMEARWQPIQNVEIASDYKYTARVSQYVLGAGDVIERHTSDDYHMLNASVAYTFLGDRVTVRGGLRNIAGVTDVALVMTSGSAHGGNSTSTPVAWGRTFIFDLQLRVP